MAAASLGVSESNLRYWERVEAAYMTENQTLKSLSKGHVNARNIPDDLAGEIIRFIEGEREERRGMLKQGELIFNLCSCHSIDCT